MQLDGPMKSYTECGHEDPERQMLNVFYMYY